MGKTDTRTTSAEKQNFEATEQLITKVCANFADRLEAKFTKKFDMLNDKLTEVNQTLKTLEQTVNSNKTVIQSITKKCDVLDQYLKRNCLRFIGFPEMENENLLEFIVNFLNDTLKVTCVLNDIDGVFRVGKSSNLSKPRAVLVSFVTNIKRNEVYYSRKLLKGTGFAMFEDLTKYRFNLLTSAKAKYGKRNAWSTNGRICVLQNNEKRIINSVDEL